MYRPSQTNVVVINDQLFTVDGVTTIQMDQLSSDGKKQYELEYLCKTRLNEQEYDDFKESMTIKVDKSHLQQNINFMFEHSLYNGKLLEITDDGKNAIGN